MPSREEDWKALVLALTVEYDRFGPPLLEFLAALRQNLTNQGDPHRGAGLVQREEVPGCAVGLAERARYTVSCSMKWIAGAASEQIALARLIGPVERR